jgi:hypothetical protein
MNKRVVSAGLWFAVALYAGSLSSGLAGTPELLGPVLGTLSATLILANPVARFAGSRKAPVGGAIVVDRLPERARRVAS